jgi:hypothetical protein
MISDPVPIVNLDEKTLEPFNWSNATSGQVWRHITNASLCDANGEFKSMLEINSSRSKTFYLSGILLSEKPLPCRNEIFVKISIQAYSIDIGANYYDDARGLWMFSGNTYYKIHLMSKEYNLAFGNNVTNIVTKFGELYDALVYRNPNNNITCGTKRICSMTIQEVKEKCNCPLDLEFVAQNKSFLRNNLKSFFVMTKSAPLFRSIESLTGLIQLA